MVSRRNSGSSQLLNYAPYSLKKRDYYRRIYRGGRSFNAARNAGQPFARPVHTSGELTRLYEDLQHWNDAKIMVTFDLIRKDWAQWLSSGAVGQSIGLLGRRLQLQPGTSVRGVSITLRCAPTSLSGSTSKIA
ncbi:hypothetical protein HWV62_702 [Athelia sp. TMB]|nr:hypothetical protein HWV62_702 [Athelia sp. TMB]